jgi:uncharacterized protein with HEPN domain
MNPIKRLFSVYLEDMLQSMARIEEYLDDIDFIAFKTNYMLVDATIRNFEIIGEAAKNIPPKISCAKFVTSHEINLSF